jgi:hypothetical protein
METIDTRTRWNSQPLSESSMEFLRALKERGFEGNGLNLKMPTFLGREFEMLQFRITKIKYPLIHSLNVRYSAAINLKS